MLSSISVEPLFPFLGPTVETEFPNTLRELELEVDDADPNAKPGPLEAPKVKSVDKGEEELKAGGVVEPKLNNAVGVVVVLEEEEVVELPLKLKTLRVALLYKGALQDEEAIELPLKL
nr:hypothetical protein Iba_chr05fCG11790 [Ipomoea batatas]